jgi:NarL family two-component system response regulator LiaR
MKTNPNADLDDSIRILIVDGYKPWRSAVNSLLQREPSFHVVAEAGGGTEAVQMVTAHSPDVVLMDIAMRGMNGLEASDRIREISPTSKIVFFTELRSPHIAERAMCIGGSGYVLKSNAASELIPALKAAFAGERFISPSVTEPVQFAY